MLNCSEDNPNYKDFDMLQFSNSSLLASADVANSSAVGNLTYAYVLVNYDPLLELVRFICEICVSLPIALAGIIGNLISIFVLRQYKPAMTTTMILQCLAWTDTAYLTASVLQRPLRHVGIPNYDYYFTYIFFWLYPTTYVIRLIDTWLTVLLTVDRFIAVCYPLHASRLCSRAKTSVLIVVIVLCSFAFSAPRYFEFIIINPSNDTLRRTALESPLMKDPSYIFIYRLSLFFIAMYLVPMTTVTILNTQLLVTFRRSAKNRATSLCINSFTSSSSHSSSSSRSVTTKASCSSSCSSASSSCSMTRTVTAVSVTVVLISIATDSVAMLSHGVWSVEQVFPHLVTLSHYRKYLANFSNVAVTLRCALNFVVYCAISRQFRVVLHRSFACCRPSTPFGVARPQQATGRPSSKISTSILSLLTGQRGPRATLVASGAAAPNVMVVGEENGCVEPNPLNQALIIRFVKR